MSEELSREERRAIRKAEKLKAKFGPEVTESTQELQTPKRSTGSTQQAQRGRDTYNVMKVGKKPKKRNHNDDAEEDENGSDSRKRRKHSEGLSPSKTAQTGSLRTNIQPDSDPPMDEPLQDVTGKGKKRKDSSRKASQTPSRAEASKKPKKSKIPADRPVTSITYPDPSADDSVPESSQKPLQYTYEFAQKHIQQNHEQWKFSKAKQNWLVRHIWYDDAVPEKYVSLVVHYLQSVKGGAREAIVKGCKILLNPPSPAVAPPVRNATDDGNENDDVAGRKVKFASVEQATDLNDATSAPASDPAEEKRVGIRRMRAQLLLDAMEKMDTN